MGTRRLRWPTLGGGLLIAGLAATLWLTCEQTPSGACDPVFRAPNRPNGLLLRWGSLVSGRSIASRYPRLLVWSDNWPFSGDTAAGASGDLHRPYRVGMGALDAQTGSVIVDQTPACR
jgi:hypothetical protein